MCTQGVRLIKLSGSGEISSVKKIQKMDSDEEEASAIEGENSEEQGNTSDEVNVDNQN